MSEFSNATNKNEFDVYECRQTGKHFFERKHEFSSEQKQFFSETMTKSSEGQTPCQHNNEGLNQKNNYFESNSEGTDLQETYLLPSN